MIQVVPIKLDWKTASEWVIAGVWRTWADWTNCSGSHQKFIFSFDTGFWNANMEKKMDAWIWDIFYGA